MKSLFVCKNCAMEWELTGGTEVCMYVHACTFSMHVCTCGCVGRCVRRKPKLLKTPSSIVCDFFHEADLTIALLLRKQHDERRNTHRTQYELGCVDGGHFPIICPPTGTIPRTTTLPHSSKRHAYGQHLKGREGGGGTGRGCTPGMACVQEAPDASGARLQGKE